MCCCGGADSQKQNLEKKEKSEKTEKDAEEGGCCKCCSCCGSCSSCGQTEASKDPNWKDKKNSLKAYKFADIDVGKFSEYNMTNFRKYSSMLTLSFNYFLNYALDIQIAYYLIKADPELYPKALPSGIAYAVFAGVGTAILGYQIYRAVKIIQADSISQAFNHAEAYRWRSIFSFGTFCFFNKITVSRSCKDKVILYVRDSILQIPQLVLVKIPQFVLVMNNIDALHLFASSESRAAIPKSQVSANMKFSTLMLELWFRVFAILILFPIVKCCCLKGSNINEYADFLIDSKVNNLVEKGGAEISKGKTDVSVGK